MILVVDDDPQVRTTIARGLVELGYPVREADGGPAALAVVREERPHLVILDYVMPRMDGAETAREIAALEPDLPIVFSTGHAALRALRSAAGEGVSVLEKPFTLAELDALIKETLAEARVRVRVGLNAVGGALQRSDVDLDHRHHRLEGPLRPARVGVGQQLGEPSRHDLPREAELVLEPAALDRLTAVGGERVPQAVDLRLILAVYGEGDRFGEMEFRAAVEAHERLAGEGELDHQHVSRRTARIVGGRALDLVDAAVGEESDVEVGGVLGLAVEP
jgi:two-component system response regulator (stage 0 sporulation protein F)